MNTQGKDHSGEDGSVFDGASTAISLIKVVPWSAIFKRIKVLFSAKAVVIGPEASGKSTLSLVLYNAGKLAEIRDHKRTREISGDGALEVTFEGPLGDRPLILRNIWDTPGQRHDVAKSVALFISDRRPQVLIFVLDADRGFNLRADEAEKDTAKWFDDLIVEAQGGDHSKEFCAALKRIKCIVVMLNKVNLIYDRLLDENLDEKKTVKKLGEMAADYEKKTFEKIKGLFAKAGRNITENEVTFIGCCLVAYKDKGTERFDNGHRRMLEVIQQDLLKRGAP
jgi:GTPase SAR1 family protein